MIFGQHPMPEVDYSALTRAHVRYLNIEMARLNAEIKGLEDSRPLDQAQTTHLEQLLQQYDITHKLLTTSMNTLALLAQENGAEERDPNGE